MMLGFFIAVLPGAIFLGLILALASRPARARLALAGFTGYLSLSLFYWFGGGWQASGYTYPLNCTALSGQMGFIALALVVGAVFLVARRWIFARVRVANWRLITGVVCGYMALSAMATAAIGLDLTLRDTTGLKITAGVCAPGSGS